MKTVINTVAQNENNFLSTAIFWCYNVVFSTPEINKMRKP
jgi:hypothetical protein